MEALPTGFYRSISAYWRRRKYQKLEGPSAGKRAVRLARLGGGRDSGRRSWRLRRIFRFRFRFRIPSPLRILARVRDLYVDTMLGVASKGSSLSGPVGPDPFLSRRIPRARSVRPKPGDFERRLMFEIYKSLSEPAGYRTGTQLSERL